MGDPVPFTGRTEVSRLLGPVASPFTAVLIGHLARCSAQDRKAMIEALHARVGNRRVARMIVSSEAPAAGAVLQRSANGSKPSALAEADRRRKKRQESEELRKQMERWKRVPVGADKW